MKLTNLVVGPIQTNCYIAEDAGETIVIDPGDDADKILEVLDGRPVKEIVLTHCHFDHVSALSALEEATWAPAAMSAVDAPRVDGQSVDGGHDIARGHGAPHIDRLLHEGDEVSVGECTFSVIETPGHTPGSICLYCASEGVLFAGDTLFAHGGYGRTDFEGGSFHDIVASMRDKLSGLPDDTIVFSGHGPRSTMRYEKHVNEYLHAN